MASSILSSTIVPMFGIFVGVNPEIKLSKYKNVVLELCKRIMKVIMMKL